MAVWKSGGFILDSTGISTLLSHGHGHVHGHVHGHGQGGVYL